MDLVQIVSERLNIDPETASKALGIIINLAKEHLSEDQQDSLRALVPNAEALEAQAGELSEVPAAGGGLLGSLTNFIGEQSGFAGILGQFQSIGLSTLQVGQLTQTLQETLNQGEENGLGSQLMQTLMSKLTG